MKPTLTTVHSKTLNKQAATDYSAVNSKISIKPPLMTVQKAVKHSDVSVHNLKLELELLNGAVK
jgi:hypothetical protein